MRLAESMFLPSKTRCSRNAGLGVVERIFRIVKRKINAVFGVGFLLSSLKNLVMELERPEPLERLPEIVSKAISEYAEDSPRLYRVHKDYFDVIKESLGELVEVFEELWRKYPRGWAKSIYLCFPNKLSRWTDICIRIRSVKREGELGVEAVTVDKMYRPEKWAAYMVYLSEPSKEELEEKLREFKEK